MKFSSKEIERSSGFEPHLPDCGVEPLLHQQNWVCYRLSLAPLLYPYCITTWAVCQGVFLFFSRFLLAPKFLRSVPVLRVEEPLGVLSLPLTSLVYHRPHQKSTGNVAQLWEIGRTEVCAICLLTKLAGCGIMEISPASIESGRLKKLLSAKAYSNSLTQQTL